MHNNLYGPRLLCSCLFSFEKLYLNENTNPNTGIEFRNEKGKASLLEYYNVFQGIKASMQGTKASMQGTKASLNLSQYTVAISKRAHKPNHTESIARDCFHETRLL